MGTKAEQVIKLVEDFKAASALLAKVRPEVTLSKREGVKVALACTTDEARLVESCLAFRVEELRAYLDGEKTLPLEPEAPPALAPVVPGKKRPKVLASVRLAIAERDLDLRSTDAAWQQWAAQREFRWPSVRNVLTEMRAAPASALTPDPPRAQVIDLGVALGAVKPTNPAAPAAQPNAQEA